MSPQDNRHSRSAVKAVLIMLLVLAVVAIAVWLLVGGEDNGSPTGTPRPSGVGDASPSPTAVLPPSPTATVNVSVDTLADELAERHPIDAYSVRYQIEYFWSGGQGEHQSSALRDVFRKNGKSKIEFVDADGAVERHVLYDADAVYTWYPGDSVYKTANSPVSVEDMIQVPCYWELSLSDDDIKLAERREENGREFIYFEFVDATMGYTHKYWLSTDFNLLERAEMYKGDTKVYQMSVVGTPSAEVPGGEHFELPQ